MNRNALAALAALTMVTACGDGYASYSEGTLRAALTDAETAGLLELVNDPSTTFETLDVTCGIRSDSARQIIKHRDGKDKKPGTRHDDLFDTVAELDDVNMVGPWTIETLTACADTLGYIVQPLHLTGTGAAVIDGSMANGEWSGAGVHHFEANLGDGNIAPATLYMMDDNVNLYVAVRVETTLPHVFSARLLFDGDADGVVISGDDMIQATAGSSFPQWQGEYFDGSIQFGQGFVADTDLGGLVHGNHSIGQQVGGFTVLEFSHPLASGDAQDISVAPGGTVSFTGFAVLQQTGSSSSRVNQFIQPNGGVSGWGYYTASEDAGEPVCPGIRQACIDYEAFCGSMSSTMRSCASEAGWARYDEAEGDPYYFCDYFFETCFEY